MTDAPLPLLMHFQLNPRSPPNPRHISPLPTPLTSFCLKLSHDINLISMQSMAQKLPPLAHPLNPKNQR